MAKLGRPTSYTQEIADRMCDMLSDGYSLRYVCELEDMPSKVTVLAWLRTNDDFLTQYTRAKQESADALADDIQDIGRKVLNREYDPNAARVAIEAKKWVAAKLKPKKYGDKLDVTSEGKSINPYANLTTEELRKLADNKS